MKLILKRQNLNALPVMENRTLYAKSFDIL